MKKNYTRPVVEVNIFDFADVVLTSSVTGPTNPSLGQGGVFNDEIKNTATSEGAIVVQW